MEKLASLGWRRDSPESSYWRYCIGNHKLNGIFKVQMDGEVVGIWTRYGDIDWNIDWKDQSFGRRGLANFLLR